MSHCPPNKKTPKLRTELRPGAASQQAAQAASELEVLRQKAADLARQSPQKAAVILSSWINGAAGARSTPRKKTG
jgi:hypothetical protein